MSFTQYLLDKYSAEFKKATEHPFLVSAGNGTIKEDTLVKWLRQDYLYAYVGYLKFASLLLSRIPINTLSPETQTTQRQKGLDKSIPLLTFSLSNIHREKNFFISTAERHELNLFVDGSLPQILDLNGDSGLLGEYEEITRSYVDFLWAVAVGGSVEDGLVLLWAMEKAYYTAWSYAKTHLPSAEPQTLKEKALREFIDNWTCEEFVGFVNDCTEVVDLLEIDPESEVGKRAEEVFKRTLWLEQRFWPDAN